MLTNEEWRRCLVSLREARKIEELPHGKPLVFGSIDPHLREWLSRKLQAMCQDGSAEMVITPTSNLTGSKTRMVFDGHFKLTAKGVDIIRRMNEEEERARKEREAWT